MEKNKRLYRIWQGMKQRCNNPKHPSATWYYHKGIRVCKDWERNFYVFQEWAVNNGYWDSATIDRIDPCKGYSPDNCQWLTRSDNSKRNKGKCHINRKAEKRKLVAQIVDICSDLGQNDLMMAMGFAMGLKAKEDSKEV